MGIETAILGSAVLGAYGANRAAKTQAKSAEQATDVQREIFNRQTELQEPWRQAGVNALARMQSGDVMSTRDPSYQFRLSEGLKALDRQAAARGGLISGGALKAAQRYGQDMASQEYGNAYNRLAALAGVGQTATNALGAAGSQYGSNVGNLMTQAGAARASGYVGGVNALTGGLGTYLNYTQGQNMLNALQSRPGFNYTPGMGGGYTYQDPMAVGPFMPPGG